MSIVSWESSMHLDSYGRHCGSSIDSKETMIIERARPVLLGITAVGVETLMMRLKIPKFCLENNSSIFSLQGLQLKAPPIARQLPHHGYGGEGGDHQSRKEIGFPQKG